LTVLPKYAKPLAMPSRFGDFTSTCATGRQFWPLDPRVEDIDIRDIARALSMQCRWGGHVRVFFSVAQHCLHVSQHCPVNPLAGLLHDSAEAYLVDVPTPIKKNLKEYASIEHNLLAVIGVKFGLGDTLANLPPEVHEQDARALATEQRDIRTKLDFWAPPGKPWSDPLLPMTPYEAENMFLSRFDTLTQMAFL
jgi:hypothetical protein